MALFLIVPRLAGQKHALELLQDATPAWLAVAVAVECVSLFFYSLLFRRLLDLLRTLCRSAWRCASTSPGSRPPISSPPAAWAARP